MPKYALFYLIFCLCAYACAERPSVNLPDVKADPFIGTGGHGHTYPGASRPFGMVQLSPDTRLEGWDGCSGYHYTDEYIYGFSHTHLSGTGVSDYGDILLMPTKGEALLENGADGQPGYRSSFLKSEEFAHPGYYEVRLQDHDIPVRLTTTPRVGYHQYQFGDSKEANVVLDLVHRDQVLDSKLVRVSNTQLVGYRHSKAWAEDQRLFFVIEFSQPFKQWGITDVNRRVHLDSLSGDYIKAFFRFETKADQPVEVKVALSAVSIEGALKNMAEECPDWDFEAVKKASETAWDQVFDRIQVSGGSQADQLKFYTALYHSYLNPNVYSDVDGHFRGMDLDVYQDTLSPHYTIFSLWDTYRATHPLLTILEQEKTNEFIRTFLRHYETGGKLPIWELSANYTGCMIFYHSIPVIADAYIKGIRKYDAKQ
ncbi:MAG: GH92 family glycosyl hydrolase, partial [Bacteroidota bacterium]